MWKHVPQHVPAHLHLLLLRSGWMEEVVVTKMIDYLKKREADGEPFFLYYPSFSVHA
jgi:hypothetical protein